MYPFHFEPGFDYQIAVPNEFAAKLIKQSAAQPLVPYLHTSVNIILEARNR